jgi:ParB family transcriptional regulator, chromosome partitioning protein
MSAKRGMGRGLAAILPEAESGEAELRELPVELIKPNPDQPRTRFDESSLAGLASSIEASGIVQPLIVRPLTDGSYELIAGERRLRAAQQAGLTRVPAVLRDQGEAERLQTALVENMVREDLNPVDEARACAALVEDLGLSKEDVGKRIGRSRSAVSNLIRLLDLPDEVLELLERGDLSEGHGRALLLTEDHAQRRSLARAAVAGRWSVRELESRARHAGAENGAAQAKRRPRIRRPLHPDQQAAVDQISDSFALALGREVEVAPGRGSSYRVELTCESLDDALELALRLRTRAAA